MRLVIFCLIFATLLASSAAWREDQERKFQKWKKDYNKNYQTTEDEEKAKDAMLSNDEQIEEHNKRFKEGKESFKRGLWKRSDLSFNEKKKILANAKDFPSNSSNLLQARPRKMKSAAPSALNWTEKGLVHAVEDQRTCGGCYAFAVAGVIEAIMLRKGIKTRLSVQQIIDCDKKNLGCNGGDPLVALNYAKNAGLGNAASYPYRNKKGKCETFEPISEVSSVRKVSLNGNEAKLMEIVAEYGPVIGDY
jgi:C1A family cysteine protease